MGRLMVLGVFLLAACGGTTDTPPGAADTDQPDTMRTNLGAFAHVTVGVADLDVALALWHDIFGLEIIASREGPDTELARLWNLQPDRISRQALLVTPGLETGAMHFVEFRNPDPPVRAGAQVFDRLPKNLDIYTQDIPAKYEDLLSRGMKFRSRWTEMPGPGGIPFREVQMLGHDDTNIVLVELVGEKYHFSPAGYASIGPLITVVADAEAEKQFYTEILGLDEILRFALAGPKIETMIGLPPGAALDFRVIGTESDPMGRIEIVEYQQTEGSDRYVLAKPPATGTLHATWQVDDLGGLRRQLDEHGVPFTEHGDFDVLFGRGPIISFTTPGGFHIEVQALQERL